MKRLSSWVGEPAFLLLLIAILSMTLSWPLLTDGLHGLRIRFVFFYSVWGLTIALIAGISRCVESENNPTAPAKTRSAGMKDPSRRV